MSDDITTVDYVCSLAPQAADREPLALTRIYVPPHVRVSEGEIVRVEGYWREDVDITPQEFKAVETYTGASIRQAAHQRGWDVEGDIALKFMDNGSQMRVAPDNGWVRGSVWSGDEEVAHVSYIDVDEAFARVQDLHRRLFG